MKRTKHMAAVVGENRHHQRAWLTRWRVFRGQTLLGASPCLAAAIRLLGTVSRDGELSGYRIDLRGAK